MLRNRRGVAMTPDPAPRVSEAQAGEKNMDKELRARLLERLVHRADRLARCATSTHPASNIDGVLALMAGHVTRTAMMLLGESFSREMWSYMFDSLAESQGICRFCNARPLRDDKTMCQVCWDQAASDDEITDEELATLGLDDTP